MRAKPSTGDDASLPLPGSTNGPSALADAHAASSSFPSIVIAPDSFPTFAGSPLTVGSPACFPATVTHAGSVLRAHPPRAAKRRNAYARLIGVEHSIGVRVLSLQV